MRWLFVILPIFLLANPSLDEVLKYPKSYYRDFWLTEYLKKSKNRQAEDIYNEITYKKDYHLKLLANRYFFYKDLYECKHITRKNWIDYPENCIVENGFKLKDLDKMGNEEIKNLLNYIPESKIKTEIEAIYTKNYKKIFANLNMFYDIFLKYTPDVEIPEIYINNIVKDRRFLYFLSLVVRSNKSNIKNSLLNIAYKNINDKYKFLLALNAISLNRAYLAIKILKSKKRKTNQDNFWLYLLTKEKNMLKSF